MNLFQIFSLLVICVLLVYGVLRFLNRYSNQECPECQRDRRKDIDFYHTALDEENVERESDSESDLSSNEEESDHDLGSDK
jgi:hypothetical protein